MKTEEDEAFEDIERKQGAWGGGFKAKQAMAADKFIAAEERKVGERYGYVPKLHPSEWMGETAQQPVNLLAARRIAAEYGTLHSQVDDGNLYFALMQCLEHIDAQPQPMQEQALLDAIVGGTGVMIGDKRIDPANIYKQPAQEPVATLEQLEQELNLEQEIYTNTQEFVSRNVIKWMLKRYYTSPPQRQPLTDDLLGLLKEARKIIRASSSRNLVKDWDARATSAMAAHIGAKP